MKALAILLLAVALRASGPQTLCGLDKPQYSENIDLLHVSCVNYDALRVQMPNVIFTGKGWATQVLIHVRAGSVAYISVDGGETYKRAPLSRDAWGRLVALVEFRGLHTDVEVRVAEERE